MIFRYHGWGLMFEKVLFATDFSDYAKKTLDCIAGFPGIAEVILLHVLEEARNPRAEGRLLKHLPRMREISSEKRGTVSNP